jgi:uncharacterized membrane protein (DUF4010 family)
MLETPEALQRLLVALLLGLLIGLDRERAEERKQQKLFAGVRTFPLIALLGAGLALLRESMGAWPLVAGFVAVVAIALVSYQASCKAGHVGATTEIAALVTFTLGALAGSGQMLIAGATGVAVAVLLAIKPRIERLSRAMTEEELAAVLQLAVISAIVLPLLPDKGYGPWQVWNPFKIWMVVVLVSAVSFAGFVAVRWKGDKAGLYWAAGLGALVSSTATTVAMAQRSREVGADSRQANRIVAATVLASVVMCGRLLALVTAVRAPLLPRLAIPMGAMIAVGLAAVLLFHRGGRVRTRSRSSKEEGKTAGQDDSKGEGKSKDSDGKRAFSNPFSLRSAITFGLLFAAILLLVRASEAWLGSRGTFLAALLSGLVDVDAITVALSRQAGRGNLPTITLAIVAACASNNLFKAGTAVFVGAGRFRGAAAACLLAMAVAGLAAAVVLAALS